MDSKEAIVPSHRGESSTGFFLVCLCLSVLFAGFTGWADFNNTEPQAAVLFLLVFGFILGAIHPKRAWVWGIILGLSICIVYFVALGLGFQPNEPPEPGWYASLIARVPAFLGTYSGVFSRKLFGTVLSPSRT